MIVMLYENLNVPTIQGVKLFADWNSTQKTITNTVIHWSTTDLKAITHKAAWQNISENESLRFRH
jgi:hypothetical protein